MFRSSNVSRVFFKTRVIFCHCHPQGLETQGGLPKNRKTLSDSRAFWFHFFEFGEKMFTPRLRVNIFVSPGSWLFPRQFCAQNGNFVHDLFPRCSFSNDQLCTWSVPTVVLLKIPTLYMICSLQFFSKYQLCTWSVPSVVLLKIATFTWRVPSLLFSYINFVHDLFPRWFYAKS